LLTCGLSNFKAMNKFIPGENTITNTTDKYLSYGGHGYNYNDYKGRFSVKFGKDERREFSSSLAAIDFFESLDEECALWDNMDLLEAKTVNPRYDGEGAVKRVFRTFQVKMSTNALSDAMYAVLLTDARIIYSYHNVNTESDKKENRRSSAVVCIEIEEEKIEMFQELAKVKSLDKPN
jgi:hypothetical protein